MVQSGLNGQTNHIDFSLAGYYGTSDSESFSEASRAGGDYLAEVCREWEDTANSAQVGFCSPWLIPVSFCFCMETDSLPQ